MTIVTVNSRSKLPPKAMAKDSGGPTTHERDVSERKKVVNMSEPCLTCLIANSRAEAKICGKATGWVPRHTRPKVHMVTKSGRR